LRPGPVGRTRPAILRDLRAGVERLHSDPRIHVTLIQSPHRHAGFLAIAKSGWHLPAGSTRGAPSECGAVSLSPPSTADPWDPIRLRRCQLARQFFHGMGRQVRLDQPDDVPSGLGITKRVGLHFTTNSHVAAPNPPRRRASLAQAAVLVGYPKVARWSTERYVCRSRVSTQIFISKIIGPTVSYAPNVVSPASVAHLAGEAT